MIVDTDTYRHFCSFRNAVHDTQRIAFQAVVDFSAYLVRRTHGALKAFEPVSAETMNSNYLTNEFMFWHSDTRDSAQNFGVPSSLPGSVFSIFTVSRILCMLHY